jgi:hypothetical protein
MLKSNLGKTERLIRLGAGLAFIALAALWKIWPLVVGAALLLTALLAWCPVSALLGVSTAQSEEELPADTTEARSGENRRDRRFK